MEALGIDPKMIIAQIINFALLFFLFNKYMAPHLVTFVQKRQEEEKKSEALLKEIQDERKAMEDERNAFNNKLKKERNDMLTLATKEAEKLKDELTAKNTKEAEQIVAKAKQAIAKEKLDFEQELKSTLSNVVKETLEKGFSDVLPKTTQKEVLEHMNKIIMNKFVKEELGKVVDALIAKLYKEHFANMEVKDFLVYIKKNATMQKELTLFARREQSRLNNIYFIETMRFVNNDEEELIKNQLPNYNNEEIVFITNSDLLGGFKATKGDYVLDKTITNKLQQLQTI